MIKMVMVTDSISQSGSWWRSTGPFSHLRNMMKQTNDIQFEWQPVDNWRWGNIAGKDICFMHRPFAEEHWQIFGWAKDYNVPIWTDWDDHTMKIPHDNSTYDAYMDPKSIDKQIRMIALSDKVTVSTHELKKELDQYRPNKDCIVVRNAIDPKWWSWRVDEPTRSDVRRVLWRGSQHHQRDLLDNKDAFIEACKAYPDFEFYFVGWKPWYIIDAVENAYHVQITNGEINKYFRALYSVRPDIVAVPLADNIFNHCKSNIAAIEGAMAGGAILAPSWDQWSISGVFQYDHEDEEDKRYQPFKESLFEMCEMAKKDIEPIRQFNKNTWECVKQDYNLNEINLTRKQIVEELISNG